MRCKIRKIIALTLIVIGTLIVFFPNISNEITKINMQEKIQDFEKVAEKIVEKNVLQKEQFDSLYYKLERYNQSLYESGQELVDAFSYKDVSASLAEYGYTENIIGFIKISKINIELPIYLGATEQNLYKGACHLSKTSFPIGGVNTNVVIAAHRGLIRNEMFKNIDRLDFGDEIVIKNLWGELKYKVVEKKIINPSDISEVYIQKNRDLVTLVTCHPYRVNTQRLIIICEREK